MGTQRARLGDMLVAAGLLSEDQLAQALEGQKETGLRLGEEVVRRGLVSEAQVTQILSNQLSVPWVSLYRVPFSRELLDLVPAQTAEQFYVIPIYVRRVRGAGETLFVAMDDPTNEQALAAVREASGMPVKPMVAAPSDVRNAIRVYYFGGRDRPALRTSQQPAAQSAPAQTTQATERERVAAGAGAPAAGSFAAEAEEWKRTSTTPPHPHPDDGPSSTLPPPPQDNGASSTPPPPPQDNGASSTPPPPADDGPSDTPASASWQHEGPHAGDEATSDGGGRSRPMMTLTLLDGTQVRLPAQQGPQAPSSREGESGALTAYDLVSALRARAQGQDVSHLLPDDRWEPLFAALLELLLRKGFIADWEFVEAWRKATSSSSTSSR